LNDSHHRERAFHTPLIQMTAKHNGNMGVMDEPDGNHEEVIDPWQAVRHPPSSKNVE
jgi:hypothetical protein